MYEVKNFSFKKRKALSDFLRRGSTFFDLIIVDEKKSVSEKVVVCV